MIVSELKKEHPQVNMAMAMESSIGTNGKCIWKYIYRSSFLYDFIAMLDYGSGWGVYFPRAHL